MFGKLFRLYGADAVIFANFGGRFSYARETCIRIADTARAPWHHFAPSVPVPAGGMAVERSRELVECFGRDTMLLIGGSLLDTEDLLGRTRLMVESVQAARDE
jgi:ribulose-bisphosphate carboxylase large chain